MFSQRVRTIYQPRPATTSPHDYIVKNIAGWGNPRKSAYVSVRLRCVPQNAFDTLESGSVAEGPHQVA